MTILTPKRPAPGNPWVFKADRIGRETEPVDLALLAKGYYIVAAPVTEQAGPTQKQWDELYQLLTSHGFSARPVMEGRGAGGGEAYYWAIHHPGKVSCIYTENPVLRSLQALATEKNGEATDKAGPRTSSPATLTDSLAPLAQAHIPILHVCGSLDPWYTDNTIAMMKKYRRLGGNMKVIVKEGAGHFGVIDNPTAIVNFIISNQR
jgi:pimeloyl-ACP methyl ester carboxylesterase